MNQAGSAPRAVGRMAIDIALLAGFLLILVPWQGPLDRLGAGPLPAPASGAPDYNRGVVELLKRGTWWRLEPDYSYFLVLNEQFASRGKPIPQLILPYGPWGFLYHGYAPGNYAPLVIAWILLAASFWWSLRALLRRAVADGWLAALVMLAILVVVSANPRGAIPLLLPLLLALRGFDEERLTPDLVALSLSVGLASLVKASSLMLSCAVVGLLAIDSVGRRRKIPAVALITGVGGLVFWVVAGQHLAWIPRFIYGSLLLSAGYADGSSTGGGGTAAALFFAVGLVLVALEGAMVWRQRRWWTVLPVLALLAAVFSYGKAGLVRYDAFHSDLASTGVLVLLLVVAARTTAALSRPVRRAAVVAAIALALACIAPLAIRGGEVLRQIEAAVNPVAAKERAEAHFRGDLASIRRKAPLPPLASADIYPYRQSVLIASGARYDPRPVIQSYFAYTGELEEWNANHLRGKNAPSFVVFEVRPTDEHYPSLDDALSWPELLARYKVRGAIPGMVLLERAARPRPWRLIPMSRMTAVIGQPVPVPGMTAPMWAVIRVRPTIFGRLASLLYKAPPLTMQMWTGDRRKSSYRLVRNAAAGGFLLSPVIAEPLDFADLHAGEWTYLERRVVTQMAISSKGGWAYDRYVDIELYQLELPPWP